MPFSFEDAVKALADEAGWRTPEPDDEGVRRILLDEGLDIELSSPDGRLFIANADLGTAPDADDEEGWLRLGRLAAGSLRAQASVLSSRSGRLALSCRIDLSCSGPNEVCEAVRRFLNDQAWWREALSEGESRLSPAPLSPFAMPGWFPGAFSL